MYSILAQGIPVPMTPSSLVLPELGSARAGFPSPAEDLQERAIDLGQVLVSHPQATFLIRARGSSMVDAGIHDNAILVVDRALKAQHQDIVVAVVDGEFTIKRLYKNAGRVKLKAANPTFCDIVPKEGQTLEIWGVVTAAINQYRK
ncbi:MAG: peptidase [Curvibacter sp. PD_MW3]|nr:MAG: peptidase [Curvibacter sp. PD_MW3]